MDGAKPSKFPHLSWLGFSFPVTAAMGTVCWNLEGTTHSLNIVFHGRGHVRWLRDGHETRYEATRGSMHFLPADGASHTLLANAHTDTDAYTLFLPERHLDVLAAEEHVSRRVEYHRLLIQQDAILESCLVRLVKPAAISDASLGAAADEAARRLVLRLIELSGGGVPAWQADGSVFDRRTLGHVVEYIDAHLTIAPALSDMGMRVGLSPSHFAKKFRQSTGLSLLRFVNRRRILASLEALKDPSRPLAHVALEHGFSSQSHFTHQFSTLTGMTPAKYRKQFKRVLG